MFFVIAFIDIKHLILPDVVQLMIFILGIIYFIVYKTGIAFDSSWQSNILSGLIWGLFIYLIWFFSKGKWIGFGDVKLMFLIGLLFGHTASLAIFYIAVFSGVIVGLIIILLKKGNMKTAIPFGAFISIIAGFSILFPNTISSIVDAFLSLI